MNDQVIMAGDELKELELCSEFSEHECEVFAEKVRVLKLDKGDYLLKEGSVDNTLYIVLSGKLVVLKGIGEGDLIKLGVLKKGDMAGQSGFIDGTPHSADIRAKKAAVVYAFDRESLESFLQTDPEITYKVMRAIVRSVHSILKNMNSLHVEMNNYINKAHGRY